MSCNSRLVAASRLLFSLILSTTALAQHEQHFTFSGPNGQEPSGGLIADAAGNLYGATRDGGTASCYSEVGCGTVFEFSPPAPGGQLTETVLYSFTNPAGKGPDGIRPLGNLVFDQQGNLYGVCYAGGLNNMGTIFQLSPNSGEGWTETVLYNFTETDGPNPESSPIFDGVGNLYGTTYGGSTQYPGVVWKLSPPSSPGGAWTETVLHTFGSGSDGIYPLNQIIFDNADNLYGSTNRGGTNGTGIIYELSPPQVSGGAWTETVLHNFGTLTGEYGASALVLGKAGTLGGTTYLGGSQGAGVFFGLIPPSSPGGAWQYKDLYDFGANGSYPTGNLAQTSSGVLYGTTQDFGNGTIFQITPPPQPNGTWQESVIYNFQGNSGTSPIGVIIHNGALWGTTALGGYNGDGTAFRFGP